MMPAQNAAICFHESRRARLGTTITDEGVPQQERRSISRRYQVVHPQRAVLAENP